MSVSNPAGGPKGPANSRIDDQRSHLWSVEPWSVEPEEIPPIKTTLN
jgi:hypothetical protein